MEELKAQTDTPHAPLGIALSIALIILAGIFLASSQRGDLRSAQPLPNASLASSTNAQHVATNTPLAIPEASTPSTTPARAAPARSTIVPPAKAPAMPLPTSPVSKQKPVDPFAPIAPGTLPIIGEVGSVADNSFVVIAPISVTASTTNVIYYGSDTVFHLHAIYDAATLAQLQAAFAKQSSASETPVPFPLSYAVEPASSADLAPKKDVWVQIASSSVGSGHLYASEVDIEVPQQ